jgi:hypothetical protein
LRACAAFACALALFAGCDKPFDNGYAVDLIVTSDGSLSDAELHAASRLEFIVTGAEMASSQYTLDRPFVSGEERVIYRPVVASGMLSFTVTARDAMMAAIGSATASVTLDPGKTVTLRVKIGKGGGDGGSGVLVVDRTSFDFGTYVSGQNATPHTFTVTNETGAPTGALTTMMGGVDTGSYTIEGDTCAGKALAAGASCTLSVRLKTGDVGTPTANLVIDGDPPGNVAVVLTGTIVAPGVLTIDPPAGDFGSIAQSQSSQAIGFTVRNTGGTATGMLSVMATGDDATLFTVTGDCNGMTLGAGATCSIMVTFAPGGAALGYKSATVLVSGTPGGATAAELRGTVIQPGSIGISPGFYDLGKVGIGSTSATQIYTLTNTGTTPTGVITTTPTGQADQFEIVADACNGQMLPGGMTCQISVRYKPTMAGTHTLVLAVSASPGGTVPATAVGVGGDFVMLTVSKSGSAGAVSAPGISCGADCTEVYDRGTMVTVNALPDMASRFGTWAGAAPCTGTGAGTCTLTMDGDKTLSATFLARPAANYMFITSTTIVPKDLGAAAADPLAAADAVCRNRAVQGGLPGTFKAFLGTTAVTPISRLGTASGWLRTDDKPFMASLATMGQGKVLYPPRLDEKATAVADDPMNMSGSGNAATASNFLGGFLGPNCTDWTAAGMYVFGYAAAVGGRWASINAMGDCTKPTHIYCFQTDFTGGVTVTAPAVMRRAFLTQNLYNPPVNGITMANGDAACNAEKTAFSVVNGAGVAGGGTYMAMLAPTGALASSRFNIAAGTAPWVRVDGVQIAATAAGLFTDSLLAGVNVTANGTHVGLTGNNSDVPYVLIGAANGITANGADGENCGNWNSSSGGAYGGRGYFVDKNWSIGDTTGCAQVGPATGNANRILCLEQ